MPLKFYIDYMSQPCRAILAFLLHNKIPHEIVETKIMDGKTRTEEFKKINPFAKVPAIEDENLCLFESHAILRYLSIKYSVPDHWYPKSPRKMAIVDRYLDWHHSYLRNGCSTTVFNTLFAPRLGITRSVNLEESRKMMMYSLKMIDQFFLKDSKYIGGEEISIADLSAACEIAQVLLMDVDLSVFKKLSSWFQLVMAIPDVEKSHQVFYKVLKKLNPQPKF